MKYLYQVRTFWKNKKYVEVGRVFYSDNICITTDWNACFKKSDLFYSRYKVIGIKECRRLHKLYELVSIVRSLEAMRWRLKAGLRVREILLYTKILDDAILRFNGDYR